jgi:hypothetical protein
VYEFVVEWVCREYEILSGGDEGGLGAVGTGGKGGRAGGRVWPGWVAVGCGCTGSIRQR